MRRTDSNASGCAPLLDVFDPLTDDFTTKERKYIHFDHKLLEVKRVNFSITPDDLSQHSFWPLLGFTKSERRIKTKDNEGIFFEPKPRHIKFGSHLDAAILEYYARCLSSNYEAYILGTPYEDAILAYRSNVGDNVTQSGDLFREIGARRNTVAIAMDIKGFFDNIGHDALLCNLKRVLNCKHLSASDFHVFKTMTKFSWVESDAVRLRLGNKYGRHRRICTAEEFRTIVRRKNESLIHVNPKKFGIPQGTPLSGLYANIALIEFDRIIFNYIKKRGGSYRRYSDDLAFLIPTNVNQKLLFLHVERNLKTVGLWLNSNKTEISKFTETENGQTSDKHFQYLGFTFDGQNTLIRASSLGRYYIKMHRGIRAKIRAAYENGVPRNEIYMRELFKKYTHYGRTRNFPRYAYRAAKILRSPNIRKQVKGHIAKFKQSVSKNINEVYGDND